MPSKKAIRLREQRAKDHLFADVDGCRRPRATFAGEPEAHAAANRVFNLTGRRYSTYECRWNGCVAWHIRPCRLRPEDLARPA